MSESETTIKASSDDSYEVYIVRAKNGRLYTGIARDAERRFREHLEGKRGARFFRFSPPEALLLRERKTDRSGALRRESEIKRVSREEKWQLIKAAPQDTAQRPPRKS